MPRPQPPRRPQPPAPPPADLQIVSSADEAISVEAVSVVPVSDPNPSTSLSDVSAGVVGGATAGVQQVAATVREGGLTGLKDEFNTNLATATEIKSTEFGPGMLGHIVRNPMRYSFAQRMEATKMVQAGQPLTTQTAYEAEQAGCCDACVVM